MQTLYYPFPLGLFENKKKHWEGDFGQTAYGIVYKGIY